MIAHQKTSKFNFLIVIALLALIIPTHSIPTAPNPVTFVESNPEERANSTIIHEETIELAEATPIIDFEAPTASALSIVESNVAQFNVSESISSQTPQSELDLDNEN
ncbi:MAG: hypothetical protein KAR20_19250, partial [Candidatus Heimdallarchaeota archaeon]|nr:hypothetical protein [Candidatus Heimdallarchaeota archaeon]